jgi:hypothetical protein
MQNIRFTNVASCFERDAMRKQPVYYKFNPLPPKPLHCSLCKFISLQGPNELQLHLDAQHKGWAERAIKKMKIRETE